MAKAFTKFTLIKTENNIFILHKGIRLEVSKRNDPQKFEEVLALLKAGDEDGVINYFIKEATLIIPEYSNGQFKVDAEKDVVIDVQTNTKVEHRLGKRIVEWGKEGLPFEPLLNFHRRLINNPNKESANDLFTFLEKNLIPISNDGRFMAYKKVHRLPDGNLVDCHTKRISNNVGDKPYMERSKVNSDRNKTCAEGLHVCGFGYLEYFPGDVVVEVLVDPADVVSVPVDYNGAKMRVCQYEVIAIFEGTTERTDKVYNSPVEDEDDWGTDEDDWGTDEDDWGTDEELDEIFEPKQAKPKVSDESHPALAAMTAQEIKDYIMKVYNEHIAINNKNKKQIIKKANQIILGSKA